MSQGDVDAGLEFVDAVNRGDIDAAVRLVHPDVVFEPLRAPTEGAFAGRDGLKRFLRDTAETFELFRVDYTDITDIPSAAIAEYRDGLMWRYKDYGEARVALEAAGLSE